MVKRKYFGPISVGQKTLQEKTTTLKFLPGIFMVSSFRHSIWLAERLVTALQGLDSVPENQAITNVMASPLNHTIGKP